MYKLRRYEERSATTRDRTCKKVGLVSEMALSSVGWVVIPIVLHQRVASPHGTERMSRCLLSREIEARTGSARH